jgi:hypothetical protein
MRQDPRPASRMDRDSRIPPSLGGPAAVADALTRSGGFVECVFHCPGCAVAGTGLARPAALEGKVCPACGDPVVLSVLDRG